jgi:hypothetical protein
MLMLKALLIYFLLIGVATAAELPGDRAPDGTILPSKRSVAENLGCGMTSGPNAFVYLNPITYAVEHLHTDRCFYVVTLSEDELDTLMHAAWLNDERRDDWLRGRRARILCAIERSKRSCTNGGKKFGSEAFAVYDATSRGWVKRGELAYSWSFAELILAANVTSNARYPNKAQPEAFAEELEAAAFFSKPENNRHANDLFHKIDKTEMGCPC